MHRLAFKTIIIVSLPLIFILVALFFIIYPHYNDIKLFAKSLNTYELSRNTSLKILTEVSRPSPEADLMSANPITSLEEIPPEELIKYQNQGNVLVELEPMNTEISIPGANISGPILDGEDAFTLNDGIWHFPLSPGPGQKGNMVVIAHRFAKLPPATDTFFNLDKVDIGDKIVINQENDHFTYTVVETKIVESHERSVLAQTHDYRITLITCTPLWTDEKRLIVIGKLDKIYGSI